MSEPTFFHGTRGGLLLPRAMHGGPGTNAPTNPGQEQLDDADQHVYVATSIDVAWAYTFAALGLGKPKVLTVRPFGSNEPDPEHSASMEACRREGAHVRAVPTTLTMTEVEAAEGWVLVR